MGGGGTASAAPPHARRLGWGANAAAVHDLEGMWPPSAWSVSTPRAQEDRQQHSVDPSADRPESGLMVIATQQVSHACPRAYQRATKGEDDGGADHRFHHPRRRLIALRAAKWFSSTRPIVSTAAKTQAPQAKTIRSR